ncbi:MAG TPA: type II toxin-antitoxin system RelE/ParE family toxin [Candidatus Paceibacterota bacterium]|nr:type II toxin-antitoxin system RelE/ParE family toxin [Candidatus Paceibacterota bacterium]HSA00094.1 type II toxin-antitoxin system RelE/ParE family toxin [Candidatus Paceibacterota bacterium]
MEVEFHPLVRGDVLEAARKYYDISPRLAGEFDVELKATIAKAAENPLRFHPTGEGFRRANLKRFPYHFLYDVQPARIRILVVRHHRRHPDFGLDRR